MSQLRWFDVLLTRTAHVHLVVQSSTEEDARRLIQDNLDAFPARVVSEEIVLRQIREQCRAYVEGGVCARGVGHAGEHSCDADDELLALTAG